MLKQKPEWKVLTPEVLLFTSGKDFAYPEIINNKSLIYNKIVEAKSSLIINCSAIEHIDNVALRVLIGLKEVAGKMGRLICLADMSPAVKNLLRTSGLSRTFLTYPDTDTALKGVIKVINQKNNLTEQQ